jgi:dipeptidyl-peptidase 4
LVAEQLGAGDDAQHLPISSLAASSEDQSLILIGPSGRWRWDGATRKLSRLDPSDGAGEVGGLRAELDLGRSSRTGPESEITFDNQLDEAVDLVWVDASGRQQTYGTVAAKSRRSQHTFSGHRWLVKNAGGERLAVFEAIDEPATAVIDGRRGELRPGRPSRRGRELLARDRSPDGKWRVFIQDFNVFIRPVGDLRETSPGKSASEEDAIKLSDDGREGFAYQQPVWSPDSKSLVAFRVEKAEIAEVHLLQSSPENGGRAILKSRSYALPGDKFTTHELNVFQIENRTQLKPQVDRFEGERSSPEVRWNVSNGKFSYRQVDRGHQRLRVIEVDPVSGEVTHLIDERSDTFVWTMHIEDLELRLLNWMMQSDELIYISERSGWRHLYLVDAGQPGELKPITSGEWVVRGVQQIDEEQRQIWFSASGVWEDQDPYLIHYGRVNFDGSGLTWLTSGNGNHSLQYSPDRRFMIDTYSRVDFPPKHELRKVADGQHVCDLEAADVSELVEAGWRAPEVFAAKGRDGKTDIWGIICRPRNFDPQQKYPIIEDIYAGPQGAFVPKTFSPSQRYQALNELGFIVVKIDGMGTANRSKAFHDVCWKNLKDGGFEDRILWMQAAAKEHPEMDLNRVGIYGVSAGGQNAAAAVLFHPEFYKVAVAGCGCHDNRMDKASWNEQWMGFPVGPHYAECSNIDNAHRLRGKLMLIVGELDDNVPPESTLRFADALIRAGKDFDLIVVPNAGHGMGGSYGERRMRDFFTRHLMGQEPPERNR